MNFDPASEAAILVPQEPQKGFPGFKVLPQLGHAAAAAGMAGGIAVPHFPQNFPFDSLPQLGHVMVLQWLSGWVYLTGKWCQQCSAVGWIQDPFSSSGKPVGKLFD
jgi:hypothetical protein